ncbi:MAG: bifunctional precorrin-2 dehydrogenase/sirohydrochlorin ferrochelatase [Sedimentisphaerales bacterium]|nr:bifunctional precorrin-2 dehydrogenase/sirohydrochlorin ferrochelatase [Sedimentisphaerales bacterium]
MAKYPIFLNLEGRRVVVIGGGTVAVRKTQVLLDCGARLVVVADNIDKMIAAFGTQKNIELIKSKYEKSYLPTAVLAIASTNDNEINKQIYKDCQELEILCNVVDVPELCDFFVPAVVKRGNLQIAISTNGNCPAYAGHLRKKLEELITEQHGKFLEVLEITRQNIIQEITEPDKRKIILGKLCDDKSFDYFLKNGSENWLSYAEELIKSLHAEIL